MKKITATSLLLSSILLLLFACNKDKTMAPPEPCDPNKVYFQQDIAPILQSNCAKSGCHDAATHEEGYDFSTYAGALEAIKKGNPSDSKLIKVIKESDPGDVMPPPPSAALQPAQIALLEKWIQQGALNETCEGSGVCNTTNMSFAADIKPIIDANCVGCHSGSSASGGYNFTTYAGVKSAVSASKLYESVVQNGAAVSMPPASKLNTCKIDQIKSWIDAGALDN